MPTVDLPEVSRLTDSAISQKQGDKGNSFLEKKKNTIKGKLDSLWTPRNIISVDGSCQEAIDSSISWNIFSYLQMFSMQCRKNITVEYNEKGINIVNFINIYTNI